MISQLAEIPMDSKCCMYCNLYFNNIVDHYINSCANLYIERARVWLEISEINNQVYIFLCSLDRSRVGNVLLGMENAEFTQTLGDKCEQFKDICGYFQCAPFPRLQTGKVVWSCLSTLNGFGSTQLPIF